MTKVKTTTNSIIILILTSTLLAGITMFPTKPVQAETTLPNDMPVIFVDPQNATANPGDTITISVKIFNISNTIHLAGASPPDPEIWSWGEPLPPADPNGRFNYSLGNLYGLDIQFSWDSNILEYVNHTVKTPVETYPDGILHEPILEVQDIVDPDLGTYSLARSTWQGLAFNKPDDNATVFEMTFNVAKIGRAYLNITSSDLVVAQNLPQYQDFFGAIPHWVKNGKFQTTVLATRIESLDVNPLDNGILFNPPVISGESAFVSTTIINDGNITDNYNLTLYWGSTEIGTLLNETLDTGERKIFNYTINETELLIGNHTVTADLSVLHGVFNFTDQIVRQFKVIGTPQLDIIGPDSATAGNSVEFTSSGIHDDPNGVIQNYTWTLWGPGETQQRATILGSIGAFDLHHGWTGGEWIVKLWVKDNYGLEYSKATADRPKIAEFYQATKILNIQAAAGPSIFDIENIILIVIVIIVIALAVVYLRRRSA